MIRRLRESKDYRDVTLDKYRLRHYLVGSQYQMWNDDDFDTVVSALRKMEATSDEKKKAKMDMFTTKCIMDADRNAGISDAIYPDYTEYVIKYPELKSIADKYGLEYYIEGKRRMRSGSSKKLNEIAYGEWRHSMPNDPTQYDRLLNYVETIVHVCDHVREEADSVLMHFEESEDFFSDERNNRYFDFDKKMNDIAKIIEQLEQVRRRIRKLEK